MRKLQTLDATAANYAPPTVIAANKIYTMNSTAEVCEAMLVHGGRVVATGSVAGCQKRAAETFVDFETVTIEGTILPGFIDAHAHPLMYGQLMTWVDCGPDKAGSIPEIVALLREAAERTPAGKPVRGFGYEHRNLAEQRHPTRHELDEVASDREVYLMNASGHGGVVNTFTLEKNGITKDTPNPEGGEFFRDAAGELTGELSDAACNILTGEEGVKIGHHGPNFHLTDTVEDHIHQLKLAQSSFLAGGVTTVGDAQVSKREFNMYLRLADAGELKIRYNMYLLSHLLDDAINIGLHGQFGNAFLSVAGIKLYADGTLGGWTAYFPEGYLGDPCRHGQLYHTPEEYTALVRKAHAVGLQTATHAQSPDAIEMVLQALEAALAEHPDADARHRIEHCGLPTPHQIARMAELGVRPVNQTQHYYNWGEGVTDAIGAAGERFNPLGEFRDAGVPITISSDAPVAEPKPLEAIQAAVTRRTRRGNVLGDESLKVSLFDAVAGHTINAAVSLGREADLGSLEPGKRADFVVLMADPFTASHNQIADIGVAQTWVDGARVFVA